MIKIKQNIFLLKLCVYVWMAGHVVFLCSTSLSSPGLQPHQHQPVVLEDIAAATGGGGED